MLNEKSMKKLAGVNPRLVSVIGAAAAICPIEFQVSEGVRSLDRQKMLYRAGKSKTMNSRHLVQPDGYGGAVDIFVVIDGKADWNLKNYAKVAEYVKKAAQQLGIPVEWGGEFKDSNGFPWPDGPHFQLKGGNNGKR